MFDPKDKNLMRNSFIVIIFFIVVFASLPFGFTYAKNEKARHFKIEQLSLKAIHNLPSVDLPIKYSIHEQVAFQDKLGNYRKGTIESIFFQMDYDWNFTAIYMIKSKERNFETREKEITAPENNNVQIHHITLSNQFIQAQELTLTKDDVITPITVLGLAGIHVYEGREEIVYRVRNTLEKNMPPYTLDESEIMDTI